MKLFSQNKTLEKDSAFRKFILEQSEDVLAENIIKDADPKDIVLGSILTISQANLEEKKEFDFEVCSVWNDPKNVFTIVNTSKDKTEANAWILFYSSNTWYVRKSLRGTVNVHVQLKFDNKEEDEK